MHGKPDYNLIDFVLKKKSALSSIYIHEAQHREYLLTKGLDAYCIEAIFASVHSVPKIKKKAPNAGVFFEIFCFQKFL